MISVIDMPPPEESSWWRGKKGFQVGFFPSECVEVIGDKVPHTFKLSNASTKPVFRRHGKLIAFFRSFLLSRPSRRKLKQSGILKERVFGCDLGEHLLNTGREIPMVLKCCAEFIEEYGVVDGIYRLSGVSSNIQRLRLAFDEDRPINLGDPATVHDIHSVASLLKMYFRELPNPLLTYQLYDKFVSAVQSNEDVRLIRVREVVKQLPPPHFRTLQYLLSHLARVASHGEETGMTPKNIAIVWAPNLLRSRDVENGGVGALHVVGVQAVLTEYLIRFSDLIFDEKVPLMAGSEQSDGFMLRTRPKSLAISTPTKLLSLEEARARALSTHLPLTQQKYIEVGGGPDKLPSKYHTVIDLPGKHGLPKLKKSPSGWKSFFSRGWSSGSTREKSRSTFRSSRKASTGSLPHTSAFMQDKPTVELDAPYGHRKKLRTVKSAESLIHCVKDSPQSTNKDDIFGDNSHKSSPQVSMDSSNSLAVSSPSSKSPGLQKHTRSSSHESYFESNSMDIISEPSFEEDEHGLFYYVNEQMRMLQDSVALPWHVDQSKFKDPLSPKSDVQNISTYEFHSIHDEIPSESEKNLRKQKLTEVDDFAQAKVQKLNEMNPGVESSSSTDFKLLDSPTEDSYYELECDHQKFGDSISESQSYFWDSQMKDSNEFSHANTELTLDPIMLYDAIINKRNSGVSSSDNEIESNNKTVVERYGNAETVLVEVHATQDSSSEEEQSIQNFQNTDEDGWKVADSLPLCTQHAPVVFHEEPELEPQKSETIEYNFLKPESFKSSLLSDHGDSPGFNSDSPLDVESIFSPIDLEFPSSSEGIVNSNIFDVSNNSIIDVTEGLSVENDTKDKMFSFSSCDETKNDSEKNTFSEDIKLRKKPASLVLNDPLSQKNLKLPENLKEESLLDNEENETCHLYSINAPPSPIYPPKSSKSSDFQALKTKMETIPLHKKKQILNIPSPSSPVEEVRKKFEPHFSNSQKKSESPSLEIRSHCHVKELASKHKKAFEVHESTNLSGNDKIRLQNVDLVKCDSFVISKRHSEPPPKATENISTDVTKRISNKYEESTQPIKNISNNEKQNKSKVSQPSLFTQLKIRKLQSLQAEVSSPPHEPIDPWSDPILDMQEDYHPLTYIQPAIVSSSSESDSNVQDNITKENEGPVQNIDFENKIQEQTDSNKDDELLDKEVSGMYNIPSETEINSYTPASDARNENDDSILSNEVDLQQLPSKSSDVCPESGATKRERINRIKEERRAQLREKLKQESFRMEAEEKEKVQTKFRLRKDCFRHSTSTETQEENLKDVKKSDKAVETDSTDITETGTNCDLSAAVESVSINRKTDSSDKAKEESIVDKDCRQETFLSSRLQRNVPKMPTDEYIFQSKSVGGKKLSRSYDDSRKWLSMPPTDIRDKVAMFERSKDTKELYRLGPNGKFPQKQSPSALASSFVR